uniref:globoside alpha-1,3-N-acetylgalactosaminyltransferase 1-like isoform X3 n=1 Tax=Oncorhynchus gorbuscha TaxID=8017 RepID=UPI001EAF4126|nr:globoside alpha-1,3-N-acetylgalactosaminyltransferase 1-like isoform X3 [Oncorhynchus gorbuscha]
MRFSSNVKPYVLLVIAGIFLLLGYVYFNFFPERLNRGILIDEDQKSTSLSRRVFRSRVRNIVSPEKLLYNQPSVLVGYVRFLQDFLDTAEKHFMVGFNMRYYVFTDRPHDVPSVNLTQGRHLSVIQVPGSNRWQEISARRMEIIQTTIERQIRREADYIFCLDVDSKFHARWGSESLGRLVAVIHPGYYEQTRDRFPYERHPASTAYIPTDEGDYYYGGAMIGGFVEDVYTLTKVCRTRFEEDAGNSIEAAWQEESHLNRYLLYNKPSKVLSPEYLWQDFKAKTKEVKVIRFSGVIKNYADVRPNV